ncbi:MAG: hypothetical protein ACLFWH_00800 [Actinomycetota bacterium]
MSRLTWVERDYGWRAGPYEIELAAPQLWVCTRRLRNGQVRVELTSGSLSALRASVEVRHRRRAQTRRSLAYLVLFVASLLIAAVATLSGWSAAPLLVLVFSGIGLFSALKTLDCVVSRSWDCLRLHYQ